MLAPARGLGRRAAIHTAVDLRGPAACRWFDDRDGSYDV